ncbi:MAG: class I SAM-dependent methyltransferase [Ignavibacteriaceae bacterium]
MSTYILMKILESSPSRYDKGISILSFGKLNKSYDRLASHIQKGQIVLDIGCGTGALTLKAASKGAIVKGIDINSQMLDIAKKRSNEMNLFKNIEFCEMGIAELESIESNSYDVIMSGLCFSELSDDELTYTLKHIKRILKLHGLLLVADEVEARNMVLKILNILIRIPLKAITYILTQTSTNAVKNLPEKIKSAGLQINTIQLNKMESFIELSATKNN